MKKKSIKYDKTDIALFFISLAVFICALPFLIFALILMSSLTRWDDGNEILKIVLIQTVIMTAGPFAVCIISLSRYHSRRHMILEQTLDSMKKIAEGDFSAEVVIKRGYDPDGIAAAFNSMALKIRTLDSMRTDFMSNVSHDMKTPMTVINGYVTNILNGSIPRDEEEKYLLLVKKEIMRLSGLVGTLLYISRLDSGDFTFDNEKFDICECARVAVITLCDKIEEKKFDFSFDCDRDNMYVTGDKDAIEKVILNLLENAVKFTPVGGKIAVCAKELNKTVTLSVYNEGEGIDREDQPFVFDRFFKVDRSRGLEKDAFGLGLYIGQKIMRAHNSDLHLRSTPGKDCEFRFTLPVAEDRNTAL